MSGPGPRRMLLVLGHSVPHDEVLSRVVALSARLSAPLHALFIEDDALLRAAALPFSTRLARGHVDSERMYEALVVEEWRALFEGARKAIQREAQRQNVRVEYEVSRGSADRVRGSEAFDLVVYAGARSRKRSLGSALPHQHQTEFVKVLYDASPAAERALDVALSLVNAAHPLEVWLSTRDEEARLGLSERLRIRLGPRVSYRELPERAFSREAVLSLLVAAGGAILVLPEESPLAAAVTALSRDVILPCVVVLTR